MHPERKKMETKKKSPLSMGSLKNLSTTERKCNKCGFVTFCLRVLYSHRYKCQGKLLGSSICCYCKRKFNYLSLFKVHRKACVKFHRNKKNLSKQKPKNLISKKCKKSKRKADSTEPSIISCSDCLKSFSSKQEYDVHVRKGFCDVKMPVQKQTFSARKSFSKVQEVEPSERDEWLSDVDDPPLNDSLPFSTSVEKKRLIPELHISGVSCKWCKNTYPTMEILQKHLKKNYQCAQQHNSYMSPFKESYTARKSFGSKQPVVARKSFSQITRRSITPSFSYASSGGSARKSLPNSKKRFLQNLKSPLMKPFSQCPVCYVKFSDLFEFIQHQKRLNHWGKATKSISSICKCPFCEKQFFHVSARNAHLRNHADKSDEEVESFLKSCTCNICSKVFASETAKYQHIKLEHPKSLFDVGSKENRNSKQSLLPLVIKQKLKQYPNSCPICSKNFPSSFSRDKHFKKKHLDSELECKFCPQRYNSVEDLEYHMQKAHYNNFKFECLACKINLATAPHVVLHVTKLHADQDPKKIIRSRDNESALFDEQGFSPNVSRNNRNKQAGFYCDICKISFQRLCGLQKHRQSKSHRDTVVRNLDSMHKSISDLPPSPPVPKKKVKHPEILTCSECLEEFTNVKDFVPHRLGHFGVHGRYLKINEENLYTCEICGEISNSHSKVQLHLFWHLQVESTSTEKNHVTVKGKNDPIVPDRLSGQHVAKKSFAKQSSESHQEVVIGGVKKPLFTCENCNIGFTTQAHYSLHVRKFCRKNVSLIDNAKETIKSSSMYLPGISTLKKHTVNLKDSNLEHCSICNCLFSSTIEETHKSFCEKCAADDTEINKDLDHITSNMDLESVIAVCTLCALPFDDSQAFANHMFACHKSATNSVSVQKTDSDSRTSTVHCTACNCLFFCPEALEDHSSFCSNSSCCDFDADSVTDILKAASKLENLIAACISCSLAFDNVQNFNNHMLLHQENLNKDLPTSLNGPQISLSSGDEMIESASVSANNTFSFDDLEQVSLHIENSKADDSVPSENLDSSSSQLPDEAMWPVTNSSGANQSSDFDEDSMMEPIDKLRNNFSQLFCMLINDSELMQQLGFGEQPVDDVLTKVLQQMGQNPVLKDGQASDIDCLRKNIRTLLDFCLKDQIMELIGSGKTSTDEIVIEALKIFTAEKTTAVVAE